MREIYVNHLIKDVWMKTLRWHHISIYPMAKMTVRVWTTVQQIATPSALLPQAGCASHSFGHVLGLLTCFAWWNVSAPSTAQRGLKSEQLLLLSCPPAFFHK